MPAQQPDQCCAHTNANPEDKFVFKILVEDLF